METNTNVCRNIYKHVKKEKKRKEKMIFLVVSDFFLIPKLGSTKFLPTLMPCFQLLQLFPTNTALFFSFLATKEIPQPMYQ